MFVMINAYGSLHFSAIFSASLLLTLVHYGAVPPLVVKAKGMNEDFSQCQSLFVCTYPFYPSLFQVVGSVSLPFAFKADLQCITLED